MDLKNSRIRSRKIGFNLWRVINIKTFYVEEPNLIFRNSKTCSDPCVGLLNYGPNGLISENFEIKIGIIGSRSSKSKATLFLNRLQYKITGKEYPGSNVRSIDFPGIYQDSPLGFYFTIVEDFCEEINDSSIEEIINADNQKESITIFSEKIKQAMSDLGGLHPKPDLVLISLPEKVLKKCCSTLDEKIILSHRYFADLKRITNLPEDERPLFFDFHNYIKVLGFEYNLKTQLVKPSTLAFSGSQSYDPALIAWNFCVASYYKSTGIPWKLADLEPETIHVGISFYNDINKRDNLVVRAAIAQVYMRTGDSQVVRGLEIPVEDDEEEKRQTHLTSEQSKEILTKAINLYVRKQNRKPLRITIHKTSPYIEDEFEGFQQASKGIEEQDYLHIKKKNSLRVLTPTEYPIMRGSVFQTKIENKQSLFMFTTGYIPALDTYPGSMVPEPIKITLEKTTSDPKRIALDMMHLTKLDWNSAAFSKRIPATISVSEKIKGILAELSCRDIEPPSAYVWYM